MALTTRDRLALAAGGLAVATLVAAAWLFATGSWVATEAGAVASADPFADPAVSGEPSPPAAEEGLVVDVQGAVVRPGVVGLPAGARVADAIAAAGGYSPEADLLAAASTLNLAAPLADGEKVFVPVTGMAAGGAGTGDGSGDGGGGGALVNLNTATPEALEALPGIGPVTVQKIVAARAERPFASLDELVERKVLNRGQADDIRDLVTV
jgi:competence protein ComEA